MGLLRSVASFNKNNTYNICIFFLVLQIWNGYDGFWQNGAVLETMVNFLAYTGNTSRRYNSVIQNGLRDLYSLLEAYGPYPSFDDMAWYGLSYARIYEVINNDQFLQTSEDIFNWCWKLGWDKTGTCGGGVWFDTNYESKQTITNAQLLQLAAKLYRLTNNTSYKTKMNQIYEYVIKNGLINMTSYKVSDGATVNCTPDDIYGPTYNAGVMLGGLAEMYKVTNITGYYELGYKLANGIFDNYCDGNGILVEPCEPNCDDDALMYKGIFVRNLRYLIDITDDPARKIYLTSWLNLQVESNLEHNMCFKVPIKECNITFKDGPPFFNISGPVFSQDWRGPFSRGNPMQQTSVLDLLTSAIKPGTVCKGIFCSYDPPVPSPRSLTCNDFPCPSGQDCCEYNNSYTCCAKGQHCNNSTGICE